MLRQTFFPRFIPLNSFHQTVLKTVEFNIQLRVGTIKIQDMSANGMLPAKFEAGKLPFSQDLPKFCFLVGLSAAKFAGNLFEAHAGRMRIAGKNFKLLTPALSSLGGEREKTLRNRYGLTDSKLPQFFPQHFRNRLNGLGAEFKLAPSRLKQFR